MAIDPKAVGREIRRRRELTIIDGKPMSQEHLGEISGVGQSTVGRLENGDFNPKKPPASLFQVAAALNATAADIGIAFDVPPQAPKRELAGFIPGDRLIGSANDFPVHASAEGGPGQLIVDSEPVERAPWPSIVSGVRGAYGLIITGSSMEPEFEAGDTAIINPHLPAIPGATFVFYAEKDGAARATIKRLRRATSDSWLVRQHNPPDGQKSDFSLSRKEWSICHRVLGKYYR
jgi:phage repressor protein C with HTH and peptisase S24 domain